MVFPDERSKAMAELADSMADFKYPVFNGNDQDIKSKWKQAPESITVVYNICKCGKEKQEWNEFCWRCETKAMNGGQDVNI